MAGVERPLPALALTTVIDERGGAERQDRALLRARLKAWNNARLPCRVHSALPLTMPCDCARKQASTLTTRRRSSAATGRPRGDWMARFGWRGRRWRSHNPGAAARASAAGVRAAYGCCTRACAVSQWPY
jgi:hypothetical protein